MNRCVIGWVPWETDSETKFSLQGFLCWSALRIKTCGRRNKARMERGRVWFWGRFIKSLSPFHGECSRTTLVFQNCPSWDQKASPLYPHLEQSFDLACQRQPRLWARQLKHYLKGLRATRATVPSLKGNCITPFCSSQHEGWIKSTFQ